MIIVAEKKDKKSVKRFYKQHNYSASYIGLDKNYLILKNNEIIASVIVSLSNIENTQHLLHGLVVAKEYQGQGFASRLLHYVSQNHKQVVCFAENKLAKFYQKNSFQQVASNSSPKEVLTIKNYLRFEAYIKNKPNLSIFIFNRGS